MISTVNSANADRIANREKNHRYTLSLIKVFFVICIVTVLIVALFLSLGIMRISETGTNILVSFVYSTAIALPSAFLLNWIGFRYSEKHPRMIVLIYALALVCAAVFGSLVANFLVQLAGIIPRHEYWHQFRMHLAFTVVITLAVGLGMTAYHTVLFKLQAATLELRTRQVEQERAYKLLAEAQLSSLESRIHPHFLFNTLNSIAALIPSDPQRAEDTVGKLASLLRFSLSANQSGLMQLSQELKIVRDYLEIEKTRFGPRLRYEIAIPEALAEINVPPLALQSLVENSVKHVVSQRSQGASIRIRGWMDSSRITLEVSDDGPGFTLDAITPEHGLGNLIARLELLFGGAGQLEVAREKERTIVRLNFPA
ncbi:MAG: histidine kinase [Terracidiphilus sp.]|jgi:sensor histidine kinase YesM